MYALHQLMTRIHFQSPAKFVFRPYYDYFNMCDLLVSKIELCQYKT